MTWLKKNISLIITILLVALVIAFFAWQIAKAPKLETSDVISKNGLHWHSTLTIKIKGETLTIPAEIGLGAVHNPMHTHETDNVIHMEYPGLVTKKDLTLGRFFEVWNKKFDQNCIFENCASEKNKLTMLVNGEANSDFENYQMKDGDKIELIYE